MKNSELYKKIQNQVRSIELLKQSKLPSNMEMQEERKMMEIERNQMFIQEMNRLQKEINKREQVKNGKASYTVPDYDALYKKFMTEFERKKSQNRKYTEPKPFALISEVRGKIIKEMKKNNEQQQQQNSRKNSATSSASRLSLASSMDSLPIKTTQAQLLRESVNREKLDEMAKKEMQREHIEKLKRMRAKKLHDQMEKKLKLTTPKSLNKNIELQTRKYRLDQHRADEEYENNLSTIVKNVECRPLLFEKLEQENAKRAVEKKYKDALRRAGINENNLLTENNSR
jgi:hypothetical protein